MTRSAAVAATAGFARAAVALVALAAAGCGGGDDDDDDDGADAGAIDVSDLVYAACEDATRIGGFAVELADAYTGVQGKVADGVVPSSVLETVATDGDCRLVAAPIFACDPACATDETCGEGGLCVPSPRSISVGTVAIAGLEIAVEMEPLPPTSYYTNPTSLPHPGYQPGAGIALDAAGGDLAPFRLRGWGVSALAIEETTVEVQAGAAVALSWGAPPADGPARVMLSLNVNGHGLVGSRIECTVDDTGAFTMPEPLITALVEDGLSGFPTLAITRSSADRVELAPGCVDFRVQTTRVLDVTVPGLVSCDGDEDCPDGQTCQLDLSCG
jgi:hypothetical protein